METYHWFDNGDTHLPPGFRFHPTDEELITHYLLRKVLDSSFTGRAIAEVDLNRCEPWELPDKAKMGEKEWYFFSLRDRKYPTGLRTNRATESGYWKATGKDREIYSSKTSSLLGMKKTLVFYKGRAPKGEKSNWVMHEYRLDGKFSYHFISRSSKDEWVISRVFQKSGTAAAATSVSSSTKKSRFNNAITLYPEASSPSSVSLPPLLDPATATSNNLFNDRESCSFDSHTQPEHVSCFSTVAAAANAATMFNNSDVFAPPLPPMSDPFARFTSRNMAVSALPSLRSLQENLQQPFFPYQPMPVPSPSFHDELGSMVGRFESAAGNSGDNGGSSKFAMGSTELDCMWSY